MARQLDTVRQWPRSVLGLVIGPCLSLCWWPMNFQCCCCSSCLSPCFGTSCCCFAWFVQPAISNFTHTCSHMTREEEQEWDRERERERALEAAFVCLCCACASSGAEDERRALSLLCGSEKAGQKGWQLHPHTRRHLRTHTY